MLLTEASPKSEHAPSRRMLIVTHGYPPAQTNGAELQAQRKAAWWHAHGYSVCVLAADPQPATRVPFDTLEEREELVEGIPVRRLRIAVPDSTRSLRETYDHPLLTAAVEREIAAFCPDVVYQVSGYLFGVAPLRVAQQRQIPTVLYATDYWHMCQRITLLRPDGTCCPGPTDPADCAACRISDRASLRRCGPGVQRLAWQTLARTARIARGVSRLAQVASFRERQAAIHEVLARTALVITESRFLARYLGTLGVRDEQLLVLRQGICGGEFPAPKLAAARADGALRLLYLGQISCHKGVDLLVEAVSQLARSGMPVQLVLFGVATDTPAFISTLRRTIDALPQQQIQLHPPLPRERLGEELRQADALVVPSRWYDNSPNVVLEAFAAGTPVVAANHGGLAEMVRDGTDGLLFAPGDARDLARVLQRLAAEPGLVADLAAGVRRPYSVDEEMTIQDAAIERVTGSTLARPA